MLGNINRIAVVDQIVDLRKGMNSLLAIAYQFNLDPLKGDILIVAGNNRSKLKILHGDATGIWLSVKLYTEDNMRHGLKFLNTGVKHISKTELIELLKGCTTTKINKK
jgi:hypothetical protein